MGEYYHSKDNQIYADFAYRTGVLVKQYEKNLPDLPVEKQFESTLYIIALQSLLTHCQELIRDMAEADKKKKSFSAEVMNCPGLFGLHKGLIKNNTFSDCITNEFFLTKIRNALSHPTPLDKSSRYPSTGYTTIPDESGKINTYCFIDSPDTKRNTPKKYGKDGEQFIRIFRSEISVTTIRDLVLGLSTYLAQPIQKDWDGKTINENLVVA